jgi:hypothetical protein
MTTITLDIPDVLAERLAQRREQLPQLLAMALELFPGEVPLSLPMSPSDHPVFVEMIGFLASGPTPAQIVAFKLSPTAQARLETLLDTHREEGLTAEETAELEVYAQVNHLLLLLKARARLHQGAAVAPHAFYLHPRGVASARQAMGTGTVRALPAPSG